MPDSLNFSVERIADASWQLLSSHEAGCKCPLCRIADALEKRLADESIPNALKQAMQLEREACAKIADQASMACRTDPGKNTADRIALKIRERQ
jgi:hypothetical protein